MNETATEKIAMLRGSSRCLVYGLLGLLPGVGVPFAILALWNGGKVRGYQKKYWNAAATYRTWGVIAATVGTIFWFLVAAVILANAFSNQF